MLVVGLLVGSLAGADDITALKARAQQGNAEAQYELGAWMYDNGEWR